MKEFIHFYYGFNIDNINQINDYYTFNYNDDIYYLIPFNQNENRLNYYIDISNRLLKYNIKSHIVINNNDGKKITYIDDVGYILLKIINNNEEINIFDIKDNQYKFLNEKISINKNHISWSELWQIKVDFLENSLNEIKKDNIIEHSYDYYIGMAENAIIYYNQTIRQYYINDYPLTWCHKRIYYPNMSINYLNPINYIIDYDIRDIAEYLKSAFFYNEKIAYEELCSYIKIGKLNNYNANLLLARLLYPSYYFDYLEKWINHKTSSNDLLNIINKQSSYEQFIKKAYQLLSNYALLIPIDYLR